MDDTQIAVQCETLKSLCNDARLFNWTNTMPGINVYVLVCVRVCVVDLFLLYDGVGFNEAFRQLLHKTNIYTWTHTHRHTLNKRNSKKIAKGVIIVCYWFTRWKFVDCLFFFSLFFCCSKASLSLRVICLFSLIQFQIKFNWSISTR